MVRATLIEFDTPKVHSVRPKYCEKCIYAMFITVYNNHYIVIVMFLLA